MFGKLLKLFKNTCKHSTTLRVVEERVYGYIMKAESVELLEDSVTRVRGYCLYCNAQVELTADQIQRVSEAGTE